MSNYLQNYKRFVRLIEYNESKNATYIQVDCIQALSTWGNNLCKVTLKDGLDICVNHSVDEVILQVDAVMDNFRRS